MKGGYSAMSKGLISTLTALACEIKSHFEQISLYICSASQMTKFYMKYKTRLKCVKEWLIQGLG